MQGCEHAAAVAEAIGQDNERAVSVHFSGFTSTEAAVANGWFDPTQKKGLDGRVIYQNRGDTSLLIEHSGGRWQVKDVSSKSQGISLAYIEGGCALEACISQRWMVMSEAKTFVSAPDVKMLSGAEAGQQVECALTNTQPPSHSNLHYLL